MAKVWDAASGRELLALKGHDDYRAVSCVAFSLFQSHRPGASPAHGR